jgi:glycerol-3-phosphate dehydrogenase
LDFGLIREAQAEKHIQMQNAPHLTQAQFFLMPLWNDAPLIPNPYWKHLAPALKKWLNLGMSWLAMACYQALAAFSGQPRFSFLSASELLRELPALRPAELTGAFRYLDGQMDDHRLGLANLCDAREHAAVSASYVKVLGFEKNPSGRIVGARMEDRLRQETFSVQAECFVNTAGPWSDEVTALVGGPGVPERMKQSRGIHLVVKGLALNDAVVLPDPESHRIAFAIPWQHGHTLIGTTDEFLNFSDPQTHYPTRAEIDYLSQLTRKYFPQAAYEITGVFSGVRPLLKAKGRPGQLSRTHRVPMHRESGLISVVGGKFTTYRAMAVDTLGHVLKQLKQRHLLTLTDSRYLPLYGAPAQGMDKLHKDIKLALADMELASPLDKLARHLGRRFGEFALSVARIMNENKAWQAALTSGLPYTYAELVFCLRHEQVLTLNDFMFRRTRLGELIGTTRMDDVTLIARFLKHHMQKSDVWETEQLQMYQDEIKARRPDLYPNQEV